MSECLFCKIVNGDIPARAVYDGTHVFGFEDINPQAPFHILLVPKTHVARMSELSEKDGAMLAELFTAAREVAEKNGFLESGYRAVLNEGPDSGQEVFHLHMHVLAGRRLHWPPG